MTPRSWAWSLDAASSKGKLGIDAPRRDERRVAVVVEMGASVQDPRFAARRFDFLEVGPPPRAEALLRRLSLEHRQELRRSGLELLAALRAVLGR
jgi:hypothetical protein